MSLANIFLLINIYICICTFNSQPRPSSSVPILTVSIIPLALICSSSTISFASYIFPTGTEASSNVLIISSAVCFDVHSATSNT